MNERPIIGPVNGTKVPRYAGSPTFARLSRIDEVSRYDVAILGAPFDGAVSFRPGARFGPPSIRQASRHPRPAFHPDLRVLPRRVIQGVDAGDVPSNPFDIDEAIQQIDDDASEAIKREQKRVAHAGFGFSVTCADDFDRLGAAEVVGRARERVGDAPLYLSGEIDVLDPVFAPGAGTPEMGDSASRELLALLRGMPGEQLVAADVGEVSPACNHAEITSLAGATVAYEIMSLMAGGTLSAPGAQS